MASSNPFPLTQSHQSRRRRDLYEDPFPIVQTTETPLIPSSDLQRDDEEETVNTSFLSSSRHVTRSTSLPKSSAPLRPVQDILNRLIWDKSLRPDDVDGKEDGVKFVIGYVDRFTGIQQVSLNDWMERRQDRDGEEWVPLHRVMWVKRKSRPDPGVNIRESGTGEEEANKEEEGEVIWDREERIDLVFRSGNSSLS